MKTILLWDARFPDRRPARLTVEDTVASAAVRAGVAAPANPADAGVLSTGGALDPGLLTEVLLQHGPGGATRRVMLPYSVMLVGAAAGVLVPVKLPITGGVIPTPGPTLNALLLSSTSFLTGGVTSVGITGKTAGSTIAATSSDGTTLSVSGSTLSGTFTVAGSPNITLTETLAGAANNPRPSVVSVTVAATAVKPNAPTIVGTSGNGRNSIAYTEDNPSGFPITSRNMYIVETGEPANAVPINFAGASPYVDLGLTNDIARKYRMSSLNINGEGPLSNTITVTPRAPTFAATYANPRVGTWGSSRDRQSIGTSGSSGTNISKTFGGPMGWVEAKVPQIIFPVWPEPEGRFQNAGTSGADGYSFANDGNDFNAMAARRPKMLAGDADIFVATQTSNSVQLTNEDGSSFSPAGYIQKMTVTFAPVLAANKRLIVQSLWERASTNVNAPPQWKPGAAARAQVEGVVANGVTYAQNTPGVSFADIRSDIVDLTGTTHDPLPGITRDGDAHFSPIGSWLAHKKIAAELRKLLSGSGNPKGIDGYKIGSNLHPNPTLTGSVAISGVTGVSGVAPTGITVARDSNGTSNATVTIAIVQVNGQNVIRVTGDTTGMTAGQFEGLTFTIASPPATIAGKWYAGAAYSKPAVFDNWRNVGRLGIGTAGFTVAALTPINSGCTPLGSLGSGSPMILPAEDMGELVAVTPFGKASAAGTLSFSQSVWWGKGTASQTFAIDLYAPEIFEMIDPHLFMYDENNTTPAAITNATTPTFPGDGVSAPTLQLNATQPGYWSVVSAANGGGADAALWTVTTTGLAKRASSFDYATPNDADADRVDQVTFQLTPFNTSMAPVSKLLNPTATYVDQGFRDNFNRANEALDASPNWTKVGTGTQSISISSNRLNVNSGSGTIAYFAPKQGDTCYQRATIRQAATFSNSAQTCVIAGKDDANYIGLRFNATGAVNVYARTAGVAGGAGSFSTIQDWSVSGAASFTGQIIKDATDGLDYVEVYQAGVLLGRAAYDMSAKQDWKLSGFAHYFSSGNTGLMDDFACVQSAPLVSKIGLRKLDATTKTGTAGQDYGSELTGRVQQDSDIAISYTGGVAGVTFLADGQVLRGTAVPAGTYVLTLVETYPGAVFNGRSSQITLTIS